MARIGVAGAAGFIGSHVVERLVAAGHAVVAIDRPGADFSVAAAAQATLAPADLTDHAATAKALHGCERAVNATGVFDLTASMEVLRAGNVEAADRFVRAARYAGIARVVHLSSVAVYGAPALTPMPEDGPLRPRTPYEVTKLQGERAALAHHAQGIEVTVLRPTLVYGPRSRYGHALMMAISSQARAVGWKRFPVLPGGPLGHHVHAEDVARAAEIALFHPGAAGQAYNVADDTPLGLGDLTDAIVGAVGLKARRIFGARILWPVFLGLWRVLPRWALERVNRALDRDFQALVRGGLRAALRPRVDRDWIGYFTGAFVFDTRRLKALGFTPAHPDFRGSVGAVVEWYRRAGWLA